jgi:hypothetical protein
MAKACLFCDDTGWVCENHLEKPWQGFSKRGDACDGGAGMRRPHCNPSCGVDEPPDMSRAGVKATLDK